jgi:hypothetical protein
MGEHANFEMVAIAESAMDEDTSNSDSGEDDIPNDRQADPNPEQREAQIIPAPV